MSNDNNEITLKEYFNTKIQEQETQFNIKVLALEKATTIAAAQMEKRLEGMNEFREALKNQSTTFFTRPEHDLYAKKNDDDIRTLRESRALLEGKASQLSTNIAMVLAIIGLLVSIIGLFHGVPLPVIKP